MRDSISEKEIRAFARDETLDVLREFALKLYDSKRGNKPNTPYRELEIVDKMREGNESNKT